MTPPLLVPGAVLADRYRVERELGAGGMAVVFLARDLRHDRLVALKVLRPELAGVLGPERFLREIQTAATLNHPHILPLFDSGQAGGPGGGQDLLFYVMPFVEGESLRERLTRARQLPVSEAVRIATEVARALEFAHKRGIVHRDIKPENILLQAGQAVVADFGIARAVDAADQRSEESLTATGLVLGTPRYMSPEQVTGGTVTGRSDVYSLGCVLYEMLAGTPPFEETTPLAVAGAHLTAVVPPLRRRRPEVSRALQSIVLGSLAKSPDDRVDATGLAAALETGVPPARPFMPRDPLAVASVALVIIIALIAWWARLPSLGGRSRSVAVLYLDNRFGDSTVQFLADGITEELILRLSQVPRLSVPSRGAVRRFRGQAVDDPQQIGQALGVSHFVSGSVQSGGDGLRIRIELVEAGNGTQVWGAAFTLGAGHDLLAMEDSVSRAVAQGVVGRLDPAEAAAMTTHRTTNPEAYEHYLRGNFYLSRRTGEADGRRALQEYQAALALDPQFSEALARLGLVYGIYASWPWPYQGLATDSLLTLGMDAANRAIALDSSSAEAWLARGFLLIPIPDGDDGRNGFRLTPGLGGGMPTVCWSRVAECRAAAIGALARAVRLAPKNAEAWYQLGRAHVPIEPGDSAIEYSLTLEPDRAVSAWLLGMHQLMRGASDSAESMLDSAIALGRRDLSVYSLRLEARLGRNDASGALEDLAIYRSLMDSDPLAAAYHASVLVAADSRAGRNAEARRRADSLVVAHTATAIRPPLQLVLAAALASSGQNDRAIAALDRAVGQTGGGFWSTLRTPRWESLRSDTRFQAIAARVERFR